VHGVETSHTSRYVMNGVGSNRLIQVGHHLVHPAWDDAHQTVGAPCRAASVCSDCVVEEKLEMLRGVVPLALWKGGPIPGKFGAWRLA
jgi:hypothetical protein